MFKMLKKFMEINKFSSLLVINTNNSLRPKEADCYSYAGCLTDFKS